MDSLKHQRDTIESLISFYNDDRFCDVTIICGGNEERASEVKVNSISILEHDENRDWCASPSSSSDDYNSLPMGGSVGHNRSSSPPVTSLHPKRQIRCHRVMLCAHSDYFCAMFNANMREASESRVVLETITYDTMKTIVDFVYHGELKLCGDSVWDILLVSNFLQMSSLVCICSDFIASSISLSNCISSFDIASNNNLSQLSDITFNFILDSFCEIMEVHGEEFNDTVSVDALEDIVRSERLNVKSELQVLQVVMDWADYDASERGVFLQRLLLNVRFPYIDTDALTTILSHYFVLKQNSEAQLFLSEKICELADFVLNCDQSAELPRPSTLDQLVVVGGMEPNSSGANMMEKLDCRLNKWERVETEMSRAQVMFGAVVLEDLDDRNNSGTNKISSRLYVVGGRQNLRTIGHVDCYDSKGHLVDQEHPRMITCRQGLSVCVLGGKLFDNNNSSSNDDRRVFAIGGHDGWNYLNSVEAINVNELQGKAKGGWVSAKSMKSTRANSGCAVIGKIIFVCGGRDGSYVLSSVERYDSLEDRWTYCAAMHVQRAHASVASLSSLLYVCGGTTSHTQSLSQFNRCTALDSCERYDPVADLWTYIQRLPCVRKMSGCGVLGNQLYIVGGLGPPPPSSSSEDYQSVTSELDSSSSSTSVFRYNPNTNKWSQVCELEYPRVGARLVVLPKQK
ncbi:kelch-like protein 5 isoform X2 [Symsagittifera roscoffensis]|uniref:kelch-like protein 5 isoform X2 n=1 Tax=Symsagittifera roscoffensis TaxID=84072 RepID=UPI00307C2DC2